MRFRERRRTREVKSEEYTRFEYLRERARGSTTSRENKYRYLYYEYAMNDAIVMTYAIKCV